MEQDLVRLLMNNKFSLTRYAVNNSSPYDTVIDFSDINMGSQMVHFLKNVTRLRGQPVKLDAQLVSTRRIKFFALYWLIYFPFQPSFSTMKIVNEI